MITFKEKLEQMRKDGKLRVSKTVPESGKKQQTTDYDLTECGIYKRFSRTTFDSIARRGINNIVSQKNYEACKKYAELFASNFEKGIGVLMLGQYGTLKTTLAVAILREVLEQGHRGLFVPMPSLMDNLFTMSRLNPGECAQYEKKIRSVKLLVIDDLGGENINSDWIQAKINSIITERHAKMLPIVITSNLTPAELKETYAGRIIDRLRSSCIQLFFTGETQRESILVIK